MNKARKYILLTVIAITALTFTFCRQSEKPAVQNEFSQVAKTDTSAASVGTVNKKIADWVQKGVECYGIVIVNFADGRTVGKAVKCKVMAIKPDQVKMKTIESVNLMESEGCNKLGLAYGDTWWETEGDLYKTKEEAETYLKAKGWYIK
jgi:hypothetical protein